MSSKRCTGQTEEGIHHANFQRGLDTVRLIANLTKIAIMKVVITQDLLIQFEKWSDPITPKAELGSFIKVHQYVSTITLQVQTALDSLKKIRNIGKI